jgi:hypothetical protein
MTDARLFGADLTAANLTHADLTDAVYDAGTKFPSEFDPIPQHMLRATPP